MTEKKKSLFKTYDSENKKRGEPRLQQIKEAIRIPLPPPLSALKFKRILLGCGIFVIAIISAIYLKNPSCLLVSLVSLFLFAAGFKINYDFYTGEICERKLLCLSSKIRKSGVDVVFVDNSENTYILSYADKKKIFFENVDYFVYTKKTMPKVIIACEEASLISK